MEVSYGTTLPVVRSTSAYVVVKLIGGRQVAIGPGKVVLHRAGTPWGATGAKLVAEARKFLGLQYLWAGTSGFAFDCSGFTHTLYAAFGIICRVTPIVRADRVGMDVRHLRRRAALPARLGLKVPPRRADRP